MKPTFDFARIAGLVVDMDGVLWVGDRPAPGLARFFALLRDHGIRFVLATNNSSRTPESYAAKLAGMGVEIGADRVLTSALATAEWLPSVIPPGAGVYVVGQDGLRRALEVAGFRLVDEPAGTAAMPAVGAVVVGIDFDLTYAKLRAATLCVRRGAILVGTNPDRSFPMEDGLAPGAGSIVAAIEAATGMKATIVGKPGPLLFEAAIARIGLERERIAVVGDQMATDIAGGRRMGLATILVMSGLESPATVRRARLRPDACFADVGELAAAWRAAMPGSGDGQACSAPAGRRSRSGRGSAAD